MYEKPSKNKRIKKPPNHFQQVFYPILLFVKRKYRVQIGQKESYELV